MKPRVSRLLVFLSLTAVVAVAAVVGLEAFLENRKDSIRRQIEVAIARPVNFDTIHLNFLERPGHLSVTLTDLRILDDPRFAATPLIHANQVTISLRWLSLFTGNPTVSDIVLDQPEIQIIRNEYGDVNIFKTAQSVDSGLQSVHRANTTVGVNRGKLYFIDRSTDKTEELQLHHLAATFQWSREQGVYVDVSGSLYPDGRQQFSVVGNLSTTRPLLRWAHTPVDLKLNMASLPKVVTSRGWKLLENQLPDYIRPSGPLAVTARISGNLNRPRLSQMRVTGRLFDGAANNATFTGDVDFSKAATWADGRVKAELILEPVTLDQIRQIPWMNRVLPTELAVHQPLKVSNLFDGKLNNLELRTSVTADSNLIQYGKWLHKAPGIAAHLAMAMQLRTNQLLINESKFKLHNGTVSFSGSIGQDPDRVARLHIKTANLPLAGWQDLVPAANGYKLNGFVNAQFSLVQKLAPQQETPIVTGELRLSNVNIIGPPGTHRNIQGVSGDLEFRGRDVEIRKLRLRAGLSDLEIRGLLVNLDRPTLHYSIQSNLLNLTDITGDAAHRADSFSNLVSEGSAEFSEGLLSVKGHLASSNGRIKSVDYRNLQGKVHWTEDKVSIQGLDVETLGGRIRGNGVFTNRAGKGFDVELSPTVELLNIHDILALSPLGAKEPVRGRLDMKGRFRSFGKDWLSVVRNLAGRGSFTLDKGVLSDFNLVRQVLAGMNAVEGIDRIDTAGPTFTPLVRDDRATFEMIEGTFTINDGHLLSNDLLLIADEYSVAGRGWANHAGHVDLRATLALSSAFSRDLRGRYRNVRYLFDTDSISLPFRLVGNIPNVATRPDVVQLTHYMYEKLAEERGPKPDRSDSFNLWKKLGQGFQKMLR